MELQFILPNFLPLEPQELRYSRTDKDGGFDHGKRGFVL